MARKSKARKWASDSGVDVKMIERYDANYYKPKKRKKLESKFFFKV